MFKIQTWQLQRRTLLFQIFATVIVGNFASEVVAASTSFKEFPLGCLPLESVNVLLKKTLSPGGRYVILSTVGKVRVFDIPEKIEEARKALEKLENAPSMISLVMNLKAGMRRVTRQYASEEPVIDYEIPQPRSYGPPQIAPQGRNPNVVPGTPRDFTTRHIEPGNRVYDSPGGFVTGTEVRMQESSVEGGFSHNYSSSGVFPNPMNVLVLRRAPDCQALRDWAVKNGGVPATGPAWGQAGTELVVTPEHCAEGLLLNIEPRIVVLDRDERPLRTIPLAVCSASVVIRRGTPVSLEGFPGADPEFYRLFFGARESVENSLAAITINAGVQSLPEPK